MRRDVGTALRALAFLRLRPGIAAQVELLCNVITGATEDLGLKMLQRFAYLDSHYLLSLDGTGYFSSSKIHCSSCLVKHHRNGKITYSHQMLGAVLVNPYLKEVIPLAPEPIIKADGDAKNDCERNATRRWLTRTGRMHRPARRPAQILRR